MDEDFDTASFDEAYDISDFGDVAGEQAFTTDEMAGGSSDISFGGDNEEGFSSFALNLSPRETYRIGRGATATNPFPESIFSKIFGAENVDYRDILGTGGIADIENLRFRQGMGMPSLKTGQPFKMGDFYVGQPTVQGQVEELPRGGILGLIEQVIPGISTLATIFGKNRGLPKNSQAYQDELKRIQESQDNIMQSFKPVTDFVGNLRTAGGDIIDKLYSGIGSLERNFRDAITRGDRDTTTNRPIEPRGVELGDMTQVFPNPMFRTGSEMQRNRGITGTRPAQATEADREVAEALQLIPTSMETNPIAPISKVRTSLLPSSVFDLLPTAQNRRDRDFARDVFASFPSLREQQFGRFNQEKPFVDSGNFIVLD